MEGSPFTTFMDLSNSIDEALDEEWVVVKKRRIIIWIPPPTAGPQPGTPKATFCKSKKAVKRNLSSPRKGGRLVSKNRCSKAAAKRSENQLHVEAQIDKPSAASVHESQTDKCEELRNQGSLQNVVAQVATGTKNNNDDHVCQRPFMQPAPPACEVIKKNSAGHCRRQTTLPLRRIGGAPRIPIGGLNFVNRRLRASNLEQKLQLLGGLSNWLLSQGLGRFIHIFEREKVGIYQLVNLTMGKLKDMGADAVGPRRKLIHALECLSKPYYFDGCK